MVAAATPEHRGATAPRGRAYQPSTIVRMGIDIYAEWGRHEFAWPTGCPRC
jgi:hypothetical protein